MGREEKKEIIWGCSPSLKKELKEVFGTEPVEEEVEEILRMMPGTDTYDPRGIDPINDDDLDLRAK